MLCVTDAYLNRQGHGQMPVVPWFQIRYERKEQSSCVVGHECRYTGENTGGLYHDPYCIYHLRTIGIGWDTREVVQGGYGGQGTPASTQEGCITIHIVSTTWRRLYHRVRLVQHKSRLGYNCGRLGYSMGSLGWMVRVVRVGLKVRSSQGSIQIIQVIMIVSISLFRTK